jgi:hypothetical protein
LKEYARKHEHANDTRLKHQRWVLKVARAGVDVFESLLLYEVDLGFRRTNLRARLVNSRHLLMR